MSAIIQGSSLAAVARELGVNEGLLLSKRVDLKGPGKERFIKDLMHSAHKAEPSKDETNRRDAATAFVTNPLAEILAPVERPGLENFLFVPGSTEQQPLLPIDQKVRLGKNSLEYPIVALSGEAKFVGAGGTRDLKRAGTADDLKSQPVAFFGVRFGWTQFELWQGQHLDQRDIEMENQRAARQAMDEFMEDVASYGSNERKIPGFFNHGSAVSYNLSKSFGDSTMTISEMLTQLSIIHLMWKRANPKRSVTGVAMPETHRLNMLKIFGGANDAAYTGISGWKHAQESFPWLNNIVTDDRLLEASDSSFSMWQLWSADPSELYLEAAPGHMLFGPFTDEMDTDFIMLNQIGGCVCKRPERIMRVQYPA